MLTTTASAHNASRAPRTSVRAAGLARSVAARRGSRRDRRPGASPRATEPDRGLRDGGIAVRLGIGGGGGGAPGGCVVWVGVFLPGRRSGARGRRGRAP